jgi:putative endonuclease
MSTEIGRAGETIAKNWLIEKKYKILATNFSSRNGEIDIIALSENKTIHFVEVKTYNNSYLHPLEAITKGKQKKIKKTATYYLLKNKKTNTHCQFDAITIQNKKIDYYPDIFN